MVKKPSAGKMPKVWGRENLMGIPVGNDDVPPLRFDAMTSALARLVKAAVGRRQQLKLWLSHLASCQPCQGLSVCEAGQAIYRPFRILNDELDEAADALAAVAPEAGRGRVADFALSVARMLSRMDDEDKAVFNECIRMARKPGIIVQA